MTRLQHFHLVFKATYQRAGLKPADLWLLIYLYPIKLFTQDDFKEGQFTMCWDKHRFYRLLREGWIKIVYNGRGTVDHNKYSVSQKTKLMIAKMGRQLDGEDIPPIKDPQTYWEKVLRTSINRFNNLKYGNERIHGEEPNGWRA